MKKYRVHWYTVSEIVHTEPDLFEASSEDDCIKQAYMKYGGRDHTPGPLILIEEVS